MSLPASPGPRGPRLTPREAVMASLLLLIVTRCWWPATTWAACLVAGTTTLVWLCRSSSDDPWLLRLALASYAVRAMLALALFLISYYGLPIFESVQRGQGFWQIGGDGIGYHETALRMLDAWRMGIDLPSVFRYGVEQYSLFKDFGLVVAGLYWLLGPALLHGLLFNAWVGAVAVVPAYGFVRLLADRNGARLAAGLVGFWPSSLIWATQLLKDSSVALAILACFYCLAVIWLDRVRPHYRARVVAAWGGFAFSVAVVTFFRNYMGDVLFVSLAAVMGMACLRHLWMRRWRFALQSLLLVAVVGLTVRTVARTDFLTLCSPPHPEIGHLRLGAHYERVGDIERAMLAYIRVLELSPEQALARDALKRLLDLIAEGRVGAPRGLAARGRNVTSAERIVDHGIDTYMRPLVLEPRGTAVRPRPLDAFIGESLEARHGLYERENPEQTRPGSSASPADPLDVDWEVVDRAMRLTMYNPTTAASASSAGVNGAYAVSAPPVSVVVSVFSVSVVPGGTVAVTWLAPAGRPDGDWLGIYPAGVPREAAGVLWWMKTNGLAYGSVTAPVPAIPASYQVVYFLNQSYEEATRSAPFTVAGNASLTPPPTLNLSAAQTMAGSGQVSTLRWTSANATNCTASEGWDGAKVTSGSERVSPELTTTYTLVCAGAGGSAAQSVVVTVKGQRGYRVSVPTTKVVPRGTIAVTWTAPSGQPEKDWLGLYPAGVPRETTNFRWWKTTGGRRHGTVAMPVPTIPGSYQVVYFKEGYEEAARSAPFTVAGSPAPLTPLPPNSAESLVIVEADQPKLSGDFTAPIESAPPAAKPLPVQAPGRRLEDVSREITLWLERLVGKLNNYRQGMIRVGGYFTVDKHVSLQTPWDVVCYLPRALSLAFLAPFPTQWFDTGGQTGAFRLLSSIEVILLALLLPGMAFACWVLVRRHGEVGQAVVAFSLLAAVALPLVIINIGILFRLRLQFVVPLLAAIGISGLPQPYQALFRRVTDRFFRRKEPAPS